MKAVALTWKKGGHNVAFHAFEIATSNAEDRDGAKKELEGLVELVNRTWEHRSTIIPDFEIHQRPTPMVVYKLLPLTNCRQCGEATCYIFAIKLIASQKKLGDCPLLAEPQNREKLTALQGIVIDAPSIGQKG